MTEKTKWEKVKEKMQDRQRAFGRVFLSEDGKKLLEVLKDEWYDGDLLGADAYETAKNLGAREVVKQLIFLRDCAKPESE